MFVMINMRLIHLFADILMKKNYQREHHVQIILIFKRKIIQRILIGVTFR
jgi:hypothetical protein